MCFLTSELCPTEVNRILFVATTSCVDAHGGRGWAPKGDHREFADERFCSCLLQGKTDDQTAIPTICFCLLFFLLHTTRLLAVLQDVALCIYRSQRNSISASEKKSKEMKQQRDAVRKFHIVSTEIKTSHALLLQGALVSNIFLFVSRRQFLFSTLVFTDQ